MSHLNSKIWCAVRSLSVAVAAVALLLAPSAHAAVPGITGTSFSLNAGVGYSSQPDGVLIYSWGYGCATGFTPVFRPTAVAGAVCPTMQLPGPPLIVTEGQSFTVNLTNSLPAAAGNTSIVFPGLTLVSTSGGTAGLLTAEAAPGGMVTYTVSAPVGTAGTHSYYSGTQADLQIEMGLFGAVVVLPATIPSTCTATEPGRVDYRLAPAAYNHALTCYDREYLTQWSEIDPKIHRQVEEQRRLIASCPTTAGLQFSCPTRLDVVTEPYHPVYFLINGRSMPDDMDANYAPNYPNQPYNANP